MIWVFLLEKKRIKEIAFFFVPFSDWLSLKEWEQQIAFQECHLAHIPVGFHNQQDETKKEKQLSPSVSVKVLRGRVLSSCSPNVIGCHKRNRQSFEALFEWYQIVSPRTTHWHQHSERKDREKEGKVWLDAALTITQIWGRYEDMTKK